MINAHDLLIFMQAYLPPREVDTINNLKSFLENPNLNVAVFAPFNNGKSTLLNCILGEEALPTGLKPVTGNPIKIIYGNSTSTSITLNNRKVVTTQGTDALKTVVLNEERNMRHDVVAVQLTHTSPFLKQNIVLYDLPGTNDMDTQDMTVERHLREMDLVIQVLDARQVLNKKEKANLQNWLVNRGITSVVFVLNFLNMVEEEGRQEVLESAMSFAKQFPSSLPEGINNFYQIDVKPAFEAIKYNHKQGRQESGIDAFLQAMQALSKHLPFFQNLRVERLTPIIAEYVPFIEETYHSLTNELQELEQAKEEQENALAKEAKSIWAGFDKSVGEALDFFEYDRFYNKFGYDAARALQNGRFRDWENSTLKTAMEGHIKNINHWINKINNSNCINIKNIPKLSISVVADPEITFPQEPRLDFGDDIINFFDTNHKERVRRDYRKNCEEIAEWGAKDYLWRTFQRAFLHIFRVQTPYFAMYSQTVDYSKNYYEKSYQATHLQNILLVAADLIGEELHFEPKEFAEHLDYYETDWVEEQIDKFQKLNAIFQETHNYTKAYEYLKALVIFTPHDLNAWYSLSFCALFVGQYDTSIHACSKVLALDINTTAIYTNLALANLLKGNYAVAERIYCAWKDIDFPNSQLLFGDVFWDDICILRRAGIKLPRYQDIQTLLGIEDNTDYSKPSYQYKQGDFVNATAVKARNIIVEKLGVEKSEVVWEASFTRDLGADSLDLAELLIEFEKEFEIAIPNEQAETLDTVGKAIEHLLVYLN